MKVDCRKTLESCNSSQILTKLLTFFLLDVLQPTEQNIYNFFKLLNKVIIDDDVSK